MIDVADWRVQRDVPDDLAAGVFALDRIWSGYSLADLEPPLRQYAGVAVAARGDDPPSAACLILRHPAFTAMVLHGPAAGVHAILQTIDLPSTAFALALPEHLAVLDRWYPTHNRLQPMQRMVVDRHTFRRSSSAVPVERLDITALSELERLYAAYPANAFNADQLRHGVFYGVRCENVIVAVGGTHALAPRSGIAALGNMWTQPEVRGRGYGRAVAAAVAAELLSGPYREVILNVAATNENAIRLYTSLGFRMHCAYFEGRVVRRDARIEEDV